MKRTLFAFLLIGIFMSACTSENYLDGNGRDDDQIGTDGNIGSGEGYYMRINLSTPPVIGSRSQASNSKWEYQNGEDYENVVNSIRFYFFDDEDKVVKVRGGNDTGNFADGFDYSPQTSEGETADTNIEKTVSVSLFLGFENGATPSKLVAILNAPQNLTKDPVTDVDKQIEKLDDLLQLVKDFQTNFTGKNFVMSNSVYVSGENTENQEVVYTVALSSDNFASTENASPKAVVVYVERVVARVDLAFGSKLKKVTDQENTFYITSASNDTETKIKPEDSGDEQTICVKILGWTVTSTPKSSRLLKKVETSWKDDDFSLSSSTVFVHWNNPNDYRSFWAINPVELEYKWWNYSDITGKEREGEKIAEGCYEATVSTAYTQENANPFETGTVIAANAKYPTKVIFGAQLVDTDGNPLEIAEYEGKYYTPSGLKSIIANSLILYTESTDGTVTAGDKRYRKITGDDIDFETANEHGNDFGPTADGTYYVYFKLKTDTDAEKKRKWFLLSSLSENTTEEMALTEDAIKQYFDNMTYPAKVWNKGYTYYYFDIPHFHSTGDAPGTYGVVRNNIYKATVNGFTSLGTPVYKPDEVIYPEQPTKNGNPLNVTVSTMQWRLIDQGLQLAW